MGPPAAVQVLKESLFRGADKVALISDKRFAAADTLATSYALRCAIVNKIGKFDLVMCGRQAIDGDTAQVGPQTAEKLGINQITYVNEIKEVTEKSITCRKAIDGGTEVVRSPLPCLLTFTDENYPPRPPSVKLLMANKNATTGGQDQYDESYLDSARKLGRTVLIDQWDVDIIGADPVQCGLSGSPTKVKKIDSVILKSSSMKLIPNTEADIGQMVHELIADHTIG
jgi:electron transfer flavoprotein beta subunit